MALTPERIVELEQQSYVSGHRPVQSEDCWGDEKITYKPTQYFNMFLFARAIEAEVRKQDEALIRQMRNALYALPLPYTSETRAALQAGNEWLDAAIAERARLEKAP